MAELPSRKLGYEEFLEWCDEDTWAEWVDGEVVVLSPASRRHQEVVGFLVQTLGVFVRARGLGVVFSARFQMETGPDLRGREPDLLFVARENLGRLRERYLDGPVDLVVEVAPPAAGCATAGRSARTTRRTGCGSTGWWTRRHSGRTSTFWVRTGGTTAGGPDGVYRSEVVTGFWLRPDWVWQDPLPLGARRSEGARRGVGRRGAGYRSGDPLLSEAPVEPWASRTLPTPSADPQGRSPG
jgi:hypothetical protein